jgi:transposase InsO family protein
MPWKETSAMDQRVRFIADWLSGDYRKTELCAAYGISRPTADKWLRRDAEGGVQGLEERSRAPHSHPHETAEAIRTMLVATKLRHQSWGPKTVMDYVRAARPAGQGPADSTAGALLKRAGLAKRRVRRLRVPPYTEPCRACQGPNQRWSADFTGDVRLGNGRRCYPLTRSDNCSRDLLLCRGVERPSDQAVSLWFEWGFREYGRPAAIRTDNGAPFASLAVGGMSSLSKWGIQLGIRPERIAPGTPSQNGRHERMHRTRKQAAPPQATLHLQQQPFDRFREQYNVERSHEAVARPPPGRGYRVSPRVYPGRVPRVEYESGLIVRRVRHNGEMKWQGGRIYVSEVLAKEPLGLRQIDDEPWEVRYSVHLLGFLDQRRKTLIPAQGWHGAQRKTV